MPLFFCITNRAPVLVEKCGECLLKACPLLLTPYPFYEVKLKKPRNKEGSQFRKLLLSTHENPKNAADVLHKVNWVVVAVDDDDACVECKRGFSVH